MPNGLALLDAETCKRLWALVPPPDVYPMVVWEPAWVAGHFLAVMARKYDGDIPAVDAVTALRMLEAAGVVAWRYSLADKWVGWARIPGSQTYSGDPEALLLAVLDAIDEGAK